MSVPLTVCVKLCTKRNTHKRHHSNTNHTMPKRSADSTEARKRRKLSADEVLEAARNGDTAAMRVALEKLSPDRDAVVFGEGNKFLNLVASNGHTETVRYLVGLPEVDVNQRVRNLTALHCAAKEGHPDVVRVLIDAGADIDTKNNGRSPLHCASDSGALEVVKTLVEAGAGVNVTDGNEGRTCLSLAASNGHTETVRYLVGLPEVDVNHRDMYNCTALDCAVKEAHADVVQVLIDAGADIASNNNDGDSPLHRASTSGALEVVKVLVRAGAGVNVTDDHGGTCLFLAAYFGHTETVRYLVGLPEVDVNHCDRKSETALHCAAKEGHPDVVRVLIDAGADIDTETIFGCSPLHCASTSGALEVVKMLVRAGAGVNATDDDGSTSLFLASRNGHTETVRYLVGLPEVDVNHRVMNNCTALYCAVKEGHTDVVQVLIDAGADIDTDNSDRHSPLLLASRSGALEVVKVFVEAGAGVRVTDFNGRTCLSLAARNGHAETVRYLVGLPEVDVNHRDMYNCTVLDCAVKERRPAVVRVLIDAGAYIDTKNEDGHSPLHCASTSGALEVVKVLVEAGAGVNVTDNEGRTCLLLAASNRHTWIVRYLVGLPEVDVNHRDSNNETALSCAVKKGHADVVQVLIDAGADIGTDNNDRR